MRIQGRSPGNWFHVCVWWRVTCFFGLHDWHPHVVRWLGYSNDVCEDVDGEVCVRCGKVDMDRGDEEHE